MHASGTLVHVETRDIGANIHAELFRQGHNATWLAEQLGHVDKGRSLRKRLRGDLPLRVQDVKRIAAVLDVSVDYLLREDTK